MFQRTRNYDSKTTREFIENIREEGLFGEHLLFPELLYCLHDLTKARDKEDFRQVVDSLLDSGIERNPTYSPKDVRFDILSKLEGICVSIDRGRISIGFPIPQPEKPGPVYSMLLELYQDELKDGYMNANRLPIEGVAL